ncbi:hypothetical protein BDQ12DRAFT_738314 [Crucibulum laeve]|uniref:Uncharacterized protein n=1 Tax=Crucibulum laeve TaxID=68775 RepID=A0A5C3LM63_9AGAR|nr:hypothetical protein BDQ12DRAFT_738314 [Crucibulum laeve]
MLHRLQLLSRNSRSHVLEFFLPDSEAHYALINRIPVELLVQIFKLCAGNEWYPDSAYVAPDPKQAPLLLCRISHHWRSVALSIPSLWSSLLVVAHCSERTRILAMAKLWLKRAASAPLSIHIQSPRHSEDRRRLRCECTYAANALDFFISHIQRCKDITVDLDPVMAERFTKLRGISVLGVEALALNIERSCSDDTVEEIIPVIASFPNLRRFSWNYPHSSFSFHIVPWSQLTHIHLITSMTLLECIIHLAQCTVATHIEFDWVEAPATEDPEVYLPPNLSVLSMVREFRLRVNGLQPAAILPHFRMPSLKSLFLTIDYYQAGCIQNSEELGKFIEESPLDDLTIIDDGGMRSADIVHLLTLPALVNVPRFELWSSHALSALDILKSTDYMIFSRLRYERSVAGVDIIEWGPTS